MILESIVTSVDPTGIVNIAPMGPEVVGDLKVGEIAFKLKPFASSRTYQNLMSTHKAVIHVTDDAGLFAKAAVGAILQEQTCQLVRPLDEGDWWPLLDCHRWFAIEVDSISDSHPRAEMFCRIAHAETVRPFFGFNRAKHAVIEAAILATRTHLLPANEILAELERLSPSVAKTAGQAETEAFQFLKDAIAQRLAELAD